MAFQLSPVHILLSYKIFGVSLPIQAISLVLSSTVIYNVLMNYTESSVCAMPGKLPSGEGSRALWKSGMLECPLPSSWGQPHFPLLMSFMSSSLWITPPFSSLTAACHMASAYLAPGVHLSCTGFDLSVLIFCSGLSPTQSTVHGKIHHIRKLYCKGRSTL